MKPSTKVAALVGALLLIILGAISVTLRIPQSVSLRRHFDRLVKTNDHGAVTRAAITVIQSMTNQVLFMDDRLTNLPPLIARMKPRYVSVEPGGMKIEFHGGFDHFGFLIEDRETSWDMSWYTEGSRQVLVSVARGEPGGAGNSHRAGE